LNKLVGTGVPSMVVKRIHRQVLCSKVTTLQHVMSIVVAVVNYIHNNEMKNRTFQVFLQEVDAKYSLTYHTEVHWLGQKAVLQHFVEI
jgi:hypothetical protein